MAAAMTTVAVARPAFVVARRTSQPTARRAALRVVRANAEPNQGGEQPAAPPAAAAAAPQVVRPPTPAKPAAPGFGEVMAFSGPAPEVVNGRLAMLGFLAALGAELSSGARVTQQLAVSPQWIAATFALFAAASLIPILKGTKNDEAFGPFTPAVELLNGRAAMIGFAALLVVEGIKGSALF